MSSIVQAKKEAGKQITKQVKDDASIINEFYDSIEKKMQTRAELLQTRLGQLAVIAVAVKRILRIFGQDLKIAGIDINQLIVGIFQIKGMKQAQTELAEAQLEQIGERVAEFGFAASASLKKKFGRCFGIPNNSSEAREKFRNFREDMKDVKVQALKLNQTLNTISGLINVIASLDDDIEKTIDLIFDWIKKIIEAVGDAVEIVVVLLEALQAAGLLANIGPFNTLPGSLTVAEAYLACILSVLNDIADAVGDLENGIVDFRESSFKLTLLFKKTVIDGAMTVSVKGRTDIV